MPAKRSTSRSRSRSSGRRDRYTVETTAFQLNFTNLATDNDDACSRIPVVKATDTQGVRKVKHLMVTLTLATTGDTSLSDYPVLWALVYWPSPNQAQTSPSYPVMSQSIWEPNQHVINCGINDPSAGPIRISTPLARNLASGDSIWLVYRIIGGNTLKSNNVVGNINGLVRYAITF